MINSRIRYFNKYILNRIMKRRARSPHTKFAIVRHIGRRSGKVYETPIIVAPRGDDFVFALTYGPNVDWYRNLMAAGHGTLLWRGRTITFGKPEPIDRARAIQAFPRLEQFVLRRLDIQHFLLVRPIAARESTPAGAAS